MLQSTSRWKKLQLDTDSVEDFARATRELKFESYNGGRDSKERLAQVTMTMVCDFSCCVFIGQSRACWWLCRTPHPSPWWSSSLTTAARTWCSRRTSSGSGKARRSRSVEMILKKTSMWMLSCSGVHRSDSGLWGALQWTKLAGLQ